MQRDMPPHDPCDNWSHVEVRWQTKLTLIMAIAQAAFILTGWTEVDVLYNAISICLSCYKLKIPHKAFERCQSVLEESAVAV